MHKNVPFVTLILFTIAITLWFGGQAGLKMHNYYSLTNKVELDVQKWTIEGNGSDKYRLIADYTSPIGKGRGAIGPIYRNPWAAEKAKERFEKQPLEAWFNPKKRQLSINKKFPTKSVLSAVVLLSITTYFIGLGVYAFDP